MSRHAVLTEEVLLWAYRQWCWGYTVGEIAEALGVTDSAISKAFTRRGWERKRRKLEYPAKSRSAYFRSLPDSELAHELLTFHNFRPYCKNLPSCVRLGDAVPRHRCVDCVVQWLAGEGK